jgi:thiol peroxidase
MKKHETRMRNERGGRALLLAAALALAAGWAAAQAPQGTLNKESTSMKERKGVITLKGNPMTLVGPELKVGDAAPECTLAANDLSPVALSSFRGKVVVLAAVPSLDTPVCDIETRRFNQEAAKLGADVKVVTVSMDLPFAQKRWCGAAGATNVVTLSDYRDAAFGTCYGVLIKELRLLARAVFVIDREGKVRYVEIVKEVTAEPNYAAVLEAVKKPAK